MFGLVLPDVIPAVLFINEFPDVGNVYGNATKLNPIGCGVDVGVTVGVGVTVSVGVIDGVGVGVIGVSVGVTVGVAVIVAVGVGDGLTPVMLIIKVWSVPEK